MANRTLPAPIVHRASDHECRAGVRFPGGSAFHHATYNGDAETAKSTSAVLLQIVNQATSATTIKSSLNPSAAGQTVTFTATVTSPTISATGSITFMDGSNVLATVTLVGARGTLSTSALSAGSHSITAVYSGTANISGSTSSALVQVVH
ncbi:MAG TPA: Ig-like domain-containing protein [Terriglobales bacterium]|nr:Ig-like domain-containing protein [Terriglobales bacterium]